MRRIVIAALLAAALGAAWKAHAACCYFTALGSDVTQPGQKAFITWDPQEEIESFTVQPRFEGNADDFGMVIPTPSRPKLVEMPRDFFKELAVFTILKPMPLDKYKPMRMKFGGPAGMMGGLGGGGLERRSMVRVLEAGVVGSLEYKIVTAERANDLYSWLKENRYSYAGDEETLNHYIANKWVFTVMRIDPKQMKRGPGGKYLGDVTPTRFTFSSPFLVYPLRITQLSVPDTTDALFYVQAPHKVDLPGPFSYQYSWTPMLRQALSFAVPEKVTAAERAWMKVADEQLGPMQQYQTAKYQQYPGWQPSRLEWARKLTQGDLDVLDGAAPYGREADPAAIKNLKILRGHLRKGQWVTKLRRLFRKGEMESDLQFVRARLGDAPDDMDYVHILPTSPP
jgi:hypothetical protein